MRRFCRALVVGSSLFLTSSPAWAAEPLWPFANRSLLTQAELPPAATPPTTNQTPARPADRTPTTPDRTPTTPDRTPTTPDATTPPSTDAFSAGAEGGSSVASSAAPNMIGDYLGLSTTSPATIITSLSDRSVANYAIVTETTQVRTTVLAFGAFKIAENESPQAQDRFYLSYNHYSTVPVVVGAETGQLVLQPAANNFRQFGGQPFPVRANLNNTLVRNPAVPLTTLSNFNVHSLEVDRETFGLEKACLDGRVSFGVRVPLYQSNQSFGPGLNGGAIAGFQTPGAGNTGTILNSYDPFGPSSRIGDVTLILKAALMHDCHTGNTLSAGVAATVPTGASIAQVGGSRTDPTLLQPFVGGYWSSGDLYVHAFSSLAISTVTDNFKIWFNDVGVGYWVYRDPCSKGLTGIAPTFEVHANTPLNDRHTFGSLLSADDVLDLTAGVHFATKCGARLTIGVSTPVSGERPFDVEGVAQMNFNF